MKTYKTQVCVVGGGSSGIGAAIGAAANGAEVILIEKNHILGGTVTLSWVHTWEPVCGTSLLCKKLWERMRKIPLGACDVDYSLSASRLNPTTGKRNRPLPFEPWAYLQAVDEELHKNNVNNIFYNSTFIASEHRNNKIKRIYCIGPEGRFAVEADYFIDSTADIYLAREAGCGWSLGGDAKSEYDEPHAPKKGDQNDLNEVNWIYRVRPTGHPVEVEKSEVPAKAQINDLFAPKMPNEDVLVNICGAGVLMPGNPTEYKKVMLEQRHLAWDSYRWQVLSGNHPDWEFIGFAPQIGIREGFRLKARYVVNENDIIAGISGQSNKEFAVTCDHRMDIHGSSFCRELDEPFGVPFESLMPKEYDNLLVACRGAGFSHIAAGSCRLSRTMLTLGEAAGKFVARNITKI